MCRFLSWNLGGKGEHEGLKRDMEELKEVLTAVQLDLEARQSDLAQRDSQLKDTNAQLVDAKTRISVSPLYSHQRLPNSCSSSAGTRGRKWAAASERK